MGGKHVVFGKLVNGMPVLMAMERCGSSNGKTSRKVVIRDCGMGTGPKSAGATGEDEAKGKKSKKVKNDKCKKKGKEKTEKKKKKKKKKKSSSSSSDDSQ